MLAEALPSLVYTGGTSIFIHSPNLTFAIASVNTLRDKPKVTAEITGIDFARIVKLQTSGSLLHRVESFI
ncbi:hypothetical protein E2C01_066528 [Portunus trituberculatus]|uniref:Uncharacterized protein n=1 Tax=Portunus trituberculatus TaxID=210409 RepID=A0A5B7HIE4_PORTR|nr:hypothetical protein [Portunus trituberculatus]